MLPQFWKVGLFCLWGPGKLVADRHLYSLDWSGLGSVWLTQCWSNSYIQSTNITKAMTGHLQVCLKLLPRLLRCLSLNPRGQKVMCMLQLCRFTIDCRGIFLLFMHQQRLECCLCSKELLFYPSSWKSILSRAQLNVDEVSFPTNETQWIQVKAGSAPTRI